MIDLPSLDDAARDRAAYEKNRRGREGKKHAARDLRGNGVDHELVAVLARGDTITPERISWVWDGWLAREMIHVLAGAPGCGKTTIALGLAATVTCGGRWPDGTQCVRYGNVLIWSGEDHPAKTIVPRFLAADGDAERLYVLLGVSEDGIRREFSPSSDMPALMDAARSIPDLDMIIIEPMIASVGGDAHKNVEVRRALQPLLIMAEERKCAVLGITHFTKSTAGRDPVERVTGSVAFGAMARVVMAAARIQDADGGEERRVFCRAKSNLGPDSGGWEYSLRLVDVPGWIDDGLQAITVSWGAMLEGQARDLLDQPDNHEDGRGKSSQDDAREFLREELKHGPVSAKDIRKMSGDAGISWSTMNRAKAALGVVATKSVGVRGDWRWSLPCDPPKFCDL